MEENYSGKTDVANRADGHLVNKNYSFVNFVRPLPWHH